MGRNATSPLTSREFVLDLQRLDMHQYSCTFSNITVSELAFPEVICMALVVTRSVQGSQTPLHVLIVIVGKYDTPDLEALHGAGQLAAEVCESWRSGATKPLDGQKLASITVVATDPDGPVQVASDGGLVNVTETTRENCVDALTAWARTVAATDGVGMLHWAGHGYTLSRNSALGVSLLCTGFAEDLPGKPSGINWSLAVEGLNTLASGRPLYCFLDTCRSLKKLGVRYRGLSDALTGISTTVQTFYSCSPEQSAFWMRPKPDRVDPPEFGGQGFGTRAFLAALTAYGARIDDALAAAHVSQPSELREAADGLMSFWMHFYKMRNRQSAEMDGGMAKAKISRIDHPKAVVEISSAAKPGAKMCDAEHVATGVVLSSHCNASPFSFTLSREPHRFRIEDIWSTEKRPIHPRTTLEIQDFEWP